MLELEHELVAVQLRLAADAGEPRRACDGGPRIRGASTAREDGERDDDCRGGDAGGRETTNPPAASPRLLRNVRRLELGDDPGEEIVGGSCARDPGLDRSNRRSVLLELGGGGGVRPDQVGDVRRVFGGKGAECLARKQVDDRRRSSGLRLEGIRGCERTQPLEREPEPTLDGPEWHAEPDGDLGLRQSFEVGERDRLELVRR